MCVAATARCRRSQMKIDKKYKVRNGTAVALRRAKAAAKATAAGRSFSFSKK